MTKKRGLKKMQRSLSAERTKFVAGSCNRCTDRTRYDTTRLLPPRTPNEQSDFGVLSRSLQNSAISVKSKIRASLAPGARHKPRARLAKAIHAPTGKYPRTHKHPSAHPNRRQNSAQQNKRAPQALRAFQTIVGGGGAHWGLACRHCGGLNVGAIVRRRRAKVEGKKAWT